MSLLKELDEIRIQKLSEGFMELTVNGSDTASDLQADVYEAIAKVLKDALKNKGNQYNTPGYLNVAMILIEDFTNFKAVEFKAVAKEAYEMLKKHADEWSESKSAQDYTRITNRLATVFKL